MLTHARFGDLFEWDGAVWALVTCHPDQRWIGLERQRPTPRTQTPPPATPLQEGSRLALECAVAPDRGQGIPVGTVTEIGPLEGTRRFARVFWYQTGELPGQKGEER